ncbi:unnamed protein product [Symbiodinium sp. CCMP2592]|nr:unnamed protein product [Symbiodinium sp. CCMP2592]
MLMVMMVLRMLMVAVVVVVIVLAALMVVVLVVKLMIIVMMVAVVVPALTVLVLVMACALCWRAAVFAEHELSLQHLAIRHLKAYAAQELGSYALMGAGLGGTGFEKLDYLQCCKFAEGDSRILMQKLTRDRLQAFAKSPSGKGKEAEACMKLGMSLKKGGKAAWNENFELAGGKNEMGKVTTTGLVRAVECDKKFQAILLEKWRRETDLDTIAERIHRRQVCQFFDFLKNKEGDMNTESAAVAYIEEGFADPEFIEAELSKAAPDLNGPVPQASQELPAAKKAAIRQVLLLYGQISRPSSQGVQEVLYRSTWCRFILDSNLVALEAEDTERPSFHKSVRLFDNISKYGKEGGQRYANLDHCVTLVVQLMMQINMPASLAWELFEEGLIKAERTVEAIYGEVQHQVDECVQVLAKEITEEAIMERRIDMFGKHGSPPQSFQGSLLAWTRGLRFWINVTTTSCLPENTVERIEQSLANEQFARDEITEPGCLYTVAKYEGLFEELFLAYCYEERTAVKEDENGKTRNEDVKHMSFAAFFRFCADFHVFPGLVSFEEAWVTYKNADCIVILGTKAQPTKVKQFKKSEVSPSRVSAILGLRTLVNRVRKGKDDPDEDKKTDTSNSEKEEEEQPSSSSSDDESSEGLEGVDSGLGESPVGFHRVRAGTAGDEIRSRVSSNASKSSKTHTVAASIASVGTVNSLQIPGQPNRSRRGVNDSEVKAALAVHRRQSIGPGDQAVIPIIRTLSEKGEQVQPESERSPLNGEGNTSEAEKKEVVVPPSRQGSKTSARGGSKGSAAGSPPPEQEEPEKPMKGSKFLHMLGSLSADKVKDIFAGSPDEPKKKEVVPPRVKTATADFQWLAKPFRDMNDKELKSYSLLIALDECCRDHFLNLVAIKSDRFHYGGDRNVTLEHLQADLVQSLNRYADRGNGLGATLHVVTGKGDWKSRKKWLQQSRYYGKDNWLDIEEKFNEPQDIAGAQETAVAPNRPFRELSGWSCNMEVPDMLHCVYLGTGRHLVP